MPGPASQTRLARCDLSSSLIRSRLVLTGGERKRVQLGKNRSAAFKANGGTVKDTGPASDQACIDELVANCDKAGGGLSTEPDGGVDCYVVGIHDQP